MPITPIVSKVNITVPDVVAFSNEITADATLIDSIAEDMAYIDGTQTVKLVRTTDTVNINIVSGLVTADNNVYTFKHALIREIDMRDNRAVKQLRLFMQSIQNDDIATVDTIIELPIRSDVTILSGDTILCEDLSKTYIVIGIDVCTLKTRWRIGARRCT